MSICNACKALIDAKQNVNPHADLKSTGGLSFTTTEGHAGSVVDYECAVCGTKMQCEIDARDDARAGWSVHL